MNPALVHSALLRRCTYRIIAWIHTKVPISFKKKILSCKNIHQPSFMSSSRTWFSHCWAVSPRMAVINWPSWLLVVFFLEKWPLEGKFSLVSALASHASLQSTTIFPPFPTWWFPIHCSRDYLSALNKHALPSDLYCFIGSIFIFILAKRNRLTVPKARAAFSLDWDRQSVDLLA
jgi:hypothetical protein